MCEINGNGLIFWDILCEIHRNWWEHHHAPSPSETKSFWVWVGSTQVMNDFRDRVPPGRRLAGLEPTVPRAILQKVFLRDGGPVRAGRRSRTPGTQEIHAEN